MALFRRNKDSSTLPEVEQYYQAERRDRTGLAWLLALVSMVIVAGILVAIFLGGRWAYNKIANNNDEDVATTETADAPSFDGASTESDNETNGSENSGDEEVPPTPTPPSQPAETTPVPSSTQTPAPQTRNSTELPHTGAGSTLVVFTGVSIAAGSAHHVLQRRKLHRN